MEVKGKFDLIDISKDEIENICIVLDLKGTGDNNQGWVNNKNNDNAFTFIGKEGALLKLSNKQAYDVWRTLNGLFGKK